MRSGNYEGVSSASEDLNVIAAFFTPNTFGQSSSTPLQPRTLATQESTGVLGG